MENPKCRCGLVTLTPAEIEWAFRVGDQRNRDRRAEGCRHHGGLPDADGQRAHRIGACAELAFAKPNDLVEQWDTRPGVHKETPDVGIWEVRGTGQVYNEQFLWLYPSDNMSRPYVLVIRLAPDNSLWKVAGWRYGWECQEIGEFRPLRPDRGPLWLVLEKDLEKE